MPLLSVILIAIGLTGLVFLLLRRLVLWYWKIDEAAYALNQIAITLERIADVLEKHDKQP